MSIWKALWNSEASPSPVGTSITQTTHGFTVGNVTPVYFDGTIWKKAIANDVTKLAIGIAIASDANIFIYYMSGIVTVTHGLTEDQFMYVDKTTAGALNVNVPTGLGEYSNPIIYTLSATSIIVLPYRPTVASNRYMMSILNVTASTHSVTQYNELLKVNATAGNATITLPTVSALYDGFSVIIKKIDASGNTVTINGNSKLIDGAATLVISTQYTAYTLIYDLTADGWSVI